MSSRFRILRSVGSGIVAMLVVACASTRHGEQGVCQECYDAVTAARESHPSTGADHNEVISRYECPCCKFEMSVYIANGVHMVKCGGCAVDGVAWDKCKLSPHESQWDAAMDPATDR